MSDQPDATCEHCKGRFSRLRKTMKFCSKSCRDKASYRRNRERTREEANAYCRQWRKDHPGSSRESKRRWEEANREKVRAMDRARYKRDKHRIADRKARVADARLRAMRSGDVSKDDLEIMWKKSGGICHYCGESVGSFRARPSIPIGFDHVMPLSRGGRHTVSNLVVCCTSCNQRKANKTPEEWLAMESEQ